MSLEDWKDVLRWVLVALVISDWFDLTAILDNILFFKLNSSDGKLFKA